MGELVKAVDMWVNPNTKADALAKYGHISNWDVSDVIWMSHLFSPNRIPVAAPNSSNLKSYLDAFNDDISDWNVSNVETMHGMFFNNTSFKGVLNKWDVGNVRDMRVMFHSATEFVKNGNTTYTQGISKWKPTKLISPGGTDADGKKLTQGGAWAMFYNLPLSFPNQTITQPWQSLSSTSGNNGLSLPNYTVYNLKKFFFQP